MKLSMSDNTIAIDFGANGIAIPLFLIVYVGQWIKAGFRYRQIRYEIEARAAEKKK